MTDVTLNIMTLIGVILLAGLGGAIGIIILIAKMTHHSSTRR